MRERKSKANKIVMEVLTLRHRTCIGGQVNNKKRVMFREMIT